MINNKENSNPSETRVLIMAGGTGGHVFPALSIAKALQDEGIRVEWLGTKTGFEAGVVPKASIPLHYISVTSWRREGLIKRLFGSILLVAAIFQAIQILRRYKPDLVIGLGGFASGPGGLAARLLGIPLVIHEQNAVAGYTNRILARLSKLVLAGFPDAFPKSIPAIWTGNPVREELSRLPRPGVRLQDRSGPLRLLIIGGSRGATALNKLCPEAFVLIPESQRPEVWHQAGGPYEKSTAEYYEEAQVKAKVQAFIQNMDEAYSWADLVICRAGALTVAELAAVGVGSILIPFPFAVDDHQTHNGRFLEALGAAKLIQQKALDPSKLAEIIMKLSLDRPALLKMAEAAREGAKPKATEQVVEYCRALIKNNSQKKSKGKSNSLQSKALEK